MAEEQTKNKGYADLETGHEYDGIKEFDNHLPKWWLITLWGAVAFTFVYWISDQTIGKHKAMTDYNQEMAAYQDDLLKKSVDPATLVDLAKDEAAVAEGAEVFKTNCETCHGPAGGGKVGPNLTDKFWKNDGSAKGIFMTVAKGVPATNMAAWLASLGPKRIASVTAYVLSIRNTNVTDGKAPEGKAYEGE